MATKDKIVNLEDLKVVGDEVSYLKGAVTGMTTATASDEGKALKAKTVSGGKVTEWEFGETATIDDTLSVAGEAADAKAAGDAVTELRGAIDDIDDVLFSESTASIDWTNAATSFFPLGWREGRLKDDGADQSSNQFIRTAKLISFDSSVDKISVTPPSGYTVTINEYSASTISSANLVKHYDSSEAPNDPSHYYGVTLGQFDSGTAGNYVNETFIAQIIGSKITVVNALEQKLDKNQGSENAGKFLSVDENGAVKLVENPVSEIDLSGLDDIEELENALFTKTTGSIDWADAATSFFPLGWREGRLKDDGADQSNNQFIRTAKLISFDSSVDKISVTPPTGYTVTINEYNSSTISSANLVKHYNTNVVANDPSHYYGFTLGQFGSGDAGDYVNSTFIAQIVGQTITYTDKKLNKNLGSVNAGKLLGIDNAGDVVPVPDYAADLNAELHTVQSDRINWIDFATTAKPLGWNTLRYNPDNGKLTTSNQRLGINELLAAGQYDRLVITPPSGKLVYVCEYSANEATENNFVKGTTGTADETVTITLTPTHYYGISIGNYGEGDSGDYITQAYLDTIVAYLQRDVFLAPLEKLEGKSYQKGHIIERGLSLASGERHDMNFGQFIRKNWMLSCCATISNFTSMEVGVIAADGNHLTELSPNGIEISVLVDATNITVTLRNNDGTANVLTPVAHGMTIADYVQLIIEGTGVNTGIVTLVCNGQRFQTTVDGLEVTHYSWPYVKATNCALSNIDFSYTCKDFDKKILIVGDSYCRYVNTRWPYYLQTWGYGDNVCINAHGGAGSYQEGVASLEHIISVMRPQYIMWCLGMNDDNDTNENTPDAQWAWGRDHLLQLCNQYGCIPVFGTVPTVHDASTLFYHGGKNKWIRNSGYQYVDFALSVGADDETGNWRTGLRESDTGKHPSALGATVMCMQALTDFPQLMITN